MTIPPRLASYLDQQGVHYDTFTHKLSRTSIETARTAHIPPQQLAKSVVLEDDQGCVMAVIPADHGVMLAQLTRLLGRPHLRLSEEQFIARQFVDCDPGAVPSVGMAWGMETIVDDALETCDTVYLECGDHERLLQLTHDEFHRLMHAQPHGHFCKPIMMGRPH